MQTALVQPQETTKLYRWPVTGRIIKEFGEQHEGINLAVPEGTKVRAAEAGRVVLFCRRLSRLWNANYNSP